LPTLNTKKEEKPIFVFGGDLEILDNSILIPTIKHLSFENPNI